MTEISLINDQFELCNFKDLHTKMSVKEISFEINYESDLWEIYRLDRKTLKLIIGDHYFTVFPKKNDATYDCEILNFEYSSTAELPPLDKQIEKQKKMSSFLRNKMQLEADKLQLLYLLAKEKKW